MDNWFNFVLNTAGRQKKQRKSDLYTLSEQASVFF